MNLLRIAIDDLVRQAEIPITPALAEAYAGRMEPIEPVEPDEPGDPIEAPAMTDAETVIASHDVMLGDTRQSRVLDDESTVSDLSAWAVATVGATPEAEGIDLVAIERAIAHTLSSHIMRYRKRRQAQQLVMPVGLEDQPPQEE